MLLRSLILLTILGNFCFLTKAQNTDLKEKIANSSQEWELLYHVARNNIRAVYTLVKEGVSLDIVDHEGNSPLEIAIQADHCLMIGTLIKLGMRIGKHDLRKAIMNGRVKAARALIILGATINDDEQGILAPVLILTILWCCKYKKLLSIIPYLIAYGANVQVKFENKMAYDYALDYMDSIGEWDYTILWLLKSHSSHKFEILKPRNSIKDFSSYRRV